MAFEGFKIDATLTTQPILTKTFAVGAGVVNEGDVVELIIDAGGQANGTIRYFQTGNNALGISRTRTQAAVGDDVEVEMLTESGGQICQVSNQTVGAPAGGGAHPAILAAANRQIGDQCRIDGHGDTIQGFAAANDMTIWDYDAVNQILSVVFQNTTF